MTTKHDPPSPPYIAARNQGGTQVPTLLVIHSTVSSTALGTARAIANMWNRPTSPKSSAHYVVDAGSTFQCVYDRRIAFHCGYNTNSLGLEMCDDPSDPRERWSRKEHVAMFERTADLAADLCLAYGIPIRFLSDEELLAWSKSKAAKDGGITTHAQMSRVFKKSTHWDPGEWPATTFLKMVKDKAMDKQKNEPPNAMTRVLDRLRDLRSKTLAKGKTQRAEKISEALKKLPKR